MRRTVLVFLLVLAGCSSTSPPKAPKPTQAMRTDGDWGGFPVHRKPRPIVLLHGMPAFRRRHGKPTDVKPPTLPTDPPPIGPTAEVRLWDGMAVLPTIDARTALTAMAAKTAVPPLRITRVDFGAAQFDTDRGQLTLPAWLFYPENTADPLMWPALDPKVFWHFDKTQGDEPSGSRVTKVDGLKLTVLLPFPNEPCQGKPAPQYHGEARESDTSVMVAAIPEHATGCAPDSSTLAPFDVTLARPLGNRVLVDGAGRPIPVN